MTTKMLGHDDRSSTESAASRGETLRRLLDPDAGLPAAGGNANAVRAGYTRHQQEIAYRALSRGHVGAARLSLRVLRADDFDQVAAISEMYLAVLRDIRASDDEVVIAAEALLRSPVRVR
jgi:hypothetical protein